MKELAKRKCVACDSNVSPLRGAALKKLQKQLAGDWCIKQGKLRTEYEFKDFRGALKFTNKIGRLAEKLGHHPDVLLAWGKVGVTIFTHKINGLTESDFILAARIEKLPRRR